MLKMDWQLWSTVVDFEIVLFFLYEIVSAIGILIQFPKDQDGSILEICVSLVNSSDIYSRTGIWILTAYLVWLVQAFHVTVKQSVHLITFSLFYAPLRVSSIVATLFIRPSLLSRAYILKHWAVRANKWNFTQLYRGPWGEVQSARSVTCG